MANLNPHFPETDADGADEYVYDLRGLQPGYLTIRSQSRERVRLPEGSMARESSRRDILKREIERNAAELARYEGFPEQDPFEDGDIIRYERVFSNTPVSGRPMEPKAYMYAAIRAAGYWYTSEQDVSKYTWSDFVDVLSSSKTRSIQVVHAYKNFDEAVADREDLMKEPPF